MPHRPIPALAAGVLAILLALPTGAPAQTADDPDADAGAAGAGGDGVPTDKEVEALTRDWSEAKMESFVRAVLAVREIYKRAGPRIEEAGSAAKKDEIRRKANREAIDAIKESRVTVEEYVAMNKAMKQDPALFQRIFAKMREIGNAAE